MSLYGYLVSMQIYYKFDWCESKSILDLEILIQISVQDKFIVYLVQTSL